MLLSGQCWYFTHMAKGFGQWRAVDLALGQSLALAWAGMKELVLVEAEKQHRWLEGFERAEQRKKVKVCESC